VAPREVTERKEERWREAQDVVAMQIQWDVRQMRQQQIAIEVARHDSEQIGSLQ
jgi:hypothetical protein